MLETTKIPASDGNATLRAIRDLINGNWESPDVQARMHLLVESKHGDSYQSILSFIAAHFNSSHALAVHRARSNPETASWIRKIEPASIPWRAVGEARGDEEDDREHLVATVQIGACCFHLDARQVEVGDDGWSLQLTDGDDATLGALYLATRADGRFQTLLIEGRDYVVFMTPFCV